MSRDFQDETITLDDLKKEYSKKNDYQIIVIEQMKSFYDSTKFCENIGGEIAVPNENVPFSEYFKVDYFYSNLNLNRYYHSVTFSYQSFH